VGPKAFSVEGRRVIQGLAIRSFQGRALRAVQGTLVAEPRADVREISAGDDDDATRARIDEVPDSLEKA
jgi:hypothetical protein